MAMPLTVGKVVIRAPHELNFRILAVSFTIKSLRKLNKNREYAAAR
jgi:hypothetical protein